MNLYLLIFKLTILYVTCIIGYKENKVFIRSFHAFDPLEA